MLRHQSVFAAGALSLALGGMEGGANAADTVPSFVTAALQQPGRPPDDRQFDAARKPGDAIAFASIKPGMKIAVVEPQGDLYYARIFSKLVGPKGHVYIFVPASGYPMQVRGAEQAALKAGKIPPVNPVDTANEIMNAADYKNVTVIWEMLFLLDGEFGLPEQVDAVWSNGSFNDWHNKNAGQGGKPLQLDGVNKAIFSALKPGGIFLVADAAAAKGAAFTQTDTLHRADPDSVKTELQAAGFVVDSESQLLANASDDHTKAADASADKYILRFKKPSSATGDKRPRGSDPLAPYYGNTIHGSIGMSVQRWDMYHPDGTYQEYGNTGSRAQQATWYWDAEGFNCHIHEFPASERSFTDCHDVEPGKKAGDEWTEGEGNAARKYKLEAGYTFPPAGGGNLPGAPPVPAAAGGPAPAAAASVNVKLASGLKPASGYEVAPAVPGKFTVVNPTDLFSDHVYTSPKLPEALSHGQTVDVLAKVKDDDWVLIGRDGTGVGYVPRTLLMPAPSAR